MACRSLRHAWLAFPLAVAGAYGCSGSSGETTQPTPVVDGGTGIGSDSDASAAALATSIGQKLDEAFVGATNDQIDAFDRGDTLFDLSFFPADGIGPVYADDACGNCHQNGLRGPGIDARMVAVLADGVTTAPDQSMFPWGFEVRNRLSAGAVTPVIPPTVDGGLVLPAGESIKVTNRNPPPILGRGYMEAVLDSEIERMESEQATRTDGIHGHINHVAYASATVADPTFGTIAQGQVVIGRFGLKARIATLDDFVADAMVNDMGITSPLRPNEPPNPDGITDDLKPGIDATLDMVNELATYMRTTAIPTRGTLTSQGAALFDQAQCSVCHAPSLKTRSDYPVAELAGIDAPIFTDLLLHDLGPALADGMTDGEATGSEYRTPALIGVRYQKAFMNDGRAHSVLEAIQLHAGEGAGAAQAFANLSASDQAALVAYVEAL